MARKKAMLKLNDLGIVAQFLGPLITRIAEEYNLAQLEPHEIVAIKEVAACDECEKLLAVSHWSGSGPKQWVMSAIDNTPDKLTSLAEEMLAATDPNDAFWVYLYDAHGSAWQLHGETVKVSYELTEI
jgi:hypothetical protein